MKPIFLFILAIFGFINAAWLNWQYERFVATGKKMFCLAGDDCTAVVGSRWGKTLGIKNELAGIFYYIFVMTLSFVLLLMPALQPLIRLPLLISITLAAGFSIYLLILQVAVIKKLCSWCIIAIGINLLLWLAAL